TREIDLNEVVREVFEFLSAQAAARRVALTTSLAPRPLCVKGDRIRLQQVILNLVMNGMESMDVVGGSAGGERRVTGRTLLARDSLAEVEIEDSGPGIAPEKVAQIFEPFFTTKESGMGMGLSIARTIVKSYDGEIWAENRRGVGAVLRFRLPLASVPQGRER